MTTIDFAVLILLQSAVAFSLGWSMAMVKANLKFREQWKEMSRRGDEIEAETKALIASNAKQEKDLKDFIAKYGPK